LAGNDHLKKSLLMINVREHEEAIQMGNSEKLATYGTQDRKIQHKHNTICIGYRKTM
jgi:hypothetical protein